MINVSVFVYASAQASADMAARWESFEVDDKTFLLQYRTANDGHVRPEHAALHNVTLPASDPFWDTYYPPNGWNCRCQVVQVLAENTPVTPHEEAYRRGAAALRRDKKGMFRFNPGKKGQTFPDYNPYTRSECRNCTRKLNLARGIPANQLCEGCLLLRKGCGYQEVPTEKGRVRQHVSQSQSERRENREIAVYLANKYGYHIDLMPKVDHIPGRKNTDSFNHTLGYKQEYKVNSAATYNSIDRAIREAKNQADSIVLKIDSDISLGTLSNAINDRVMRSKNITEIIVIRNDKDVFYTREQMVSEGFKIQEEDFK